MNSIDEKLFNFIFGIFAGMNDYVSHAKEEMDIAKVNGYFAGVIKAEAEHSITSSILDDMSDSWKTFLMENQDVEERLKTLSIVTDIEQSQKIH